MRSMHSVYCHGLFSDFLYGRHRRAGPGVFAVGFSSGSIAFVHLLLEIIDVYSKTFTNLSISLRGLKFGRVRYV